MNDLIIIGFISISIKINSEEKTGGGHMTPGGNRPPFETIMVGIDIQWANHLPHYQKFGGIFVSVHRHRPSIMILVQATNSKKWCLTFPLNESGHYHQIYGITIYQ